MADFYKMDPALWDVRTSNLTLDQEAAYLRIVNAIHKHKSPVPDNDRVLAGMFRVSTRKARALVNALIDAGKISIDGEYITNERAVSDLVHRGFVSVSMAENGAKGGRKRAELAAKSLENIDHGQATASYREEKRREENTVAKATVSHTVKFAQDMFEEFWDRYPKRIGKADAHKAYARAMKKITHDDLMFALSERLPALAAKDKQYRPNPATWLNQERWTDDIDTGSDTGRSRTGGTGNAMVDAFAAVAAARIARNAGH
jgi:uncharacterized protein YdaU (DUF1376 family)